MSTNDKQIMDVANGLAEQVMEELKEAASGGRKRRYARFVLAALSSIPWVGGFLSATAGLDAEMQQERFNELHLLWLEEHKEKIQELGKTLSRILNRLEQFDEEIKGRIESPQYLDLVKKGFRSWDQADTHEKRRLLTRLLTNAGATKLCPDDLVRLFIDWIDHYHESHFLVIKEIYKSPGITRGQIWDNIHGQETREDAAEADLFKLLIRDLSTGGVIRQRRQTDAAGRFMTKPVRKKSKGRSRVMKSAFDYVEPYELTELGTQFVHYTMEEVVPRIR